MVCRPRSETSSSRIERRPADSLLQTSVCLVAHSGILMNWKECTQRCDLWQPVASTLGGRYKETTDNEGIPQAGQLVPGRDSKPGHPEYEVQVLSSENLSSFKERGRTTEKLSVSGTMGEIREH